MTATSLARIERLNLVFGGIFCIGGALLGTRAQALGIVVGVVLTCLNFMALRRLVAAATTKAADAKSSHRTLLILPKMTGLLAAVALSLLFLPISPAAFALGYSVFVISIIVETTYSLLSPTAATPANEHDHG